MNAPEWRKLALDLLARQAPCHECNEPATRVGCVGAHSESDHGEWCDECANGSTYTNDLPQAAAVRAILAAKGRVTP